MIVDYHMHLRDRDERIAHRADAVEPFVETAARRGVDEIGFTEHVYYFRQTRALWDRPYESERCVYDLEAYVDAVVEAKRQGLPVKLGLEVDHVGDRQDELAAMLEPYPWDFLLGSVHNVDGLAIDSAPVKGVPTLPWSTSKSDFPVLKSPANFNRAVALSLESVEERFRSAIAFQHIA